MAYNPYFPVSYQPMYQQSYQPTFAQGQQQMQPLVQQPYQTAQQPQQNSNTITWVQGEAAAKSFPCAPGTSVLLMDSEANVFYIRSTDTSGMPLPLRVFDYKERAQQQSSSSSVAAKETIPVEQINLSDYVTKEEFERRLARLETATTSTEGTTTIRAASRKDKANG